MREFTSANNSWNDVADRGGDKDSVSIWFVRQALMGLRASGLDPDPLLYGAGIQPRMLQSDHSRVSARSFGALWLAIAAALDDELFGLDSRRMKVGSFALLCRAAVEAPNLRRALALATQFFNVLMDDTRLDTTESEGRVCIHLMETGYRRDPAFTVFAHETVLIMLHGLMCWLIGRRIPIRQASFAYPQPVWGREYLTMYSSELAFEQPSTGIELNSRVLDAAVVQNDETTREFLREAPHNFIVKFKDAKSCQARVRKRLRSTPPDRWPSLPTLAAELGLAYSTLHRRLEQEGTRFREIKDGLRRDLAIDRLTHSDISVANLAAELGFAEPSAFHRAFKLWTGLRPGDYRRSDVPIA
ncbi:MAG: AraC family transcriptional regulator [Panacagrimonas sp.]